MRKIRIASIIIFILSAVFFGYFKLSYKKAVDTEGPSIHMEQDTIQIPVGAGEEEILAGVTANDKKDGDVSSSLMIEELTDFTERGKRLATIAAFDHDNNVTRETREIIYSDYEPPRFALSAPLYFPVNTDSIMSSISASDGLDGDLTQNIKVSSDEQIWLNQEGDYQVVYSVANSAKDQVQLPVTVTIYDPVEYQSLPVISLNQYLVYINRGETIDPWSFVEEVSYRGRTYKPDVSSTGKDILAEEMSETDDENASEDRYSREEERRYLTDIEIDNKLDSNTPGTYEIVYKVTADAEYGYESGTMRLIVVVEE